VGNTVAAVVMKGPVQGLQIGALPPVHTLLQGARPELTGDFGDFCIQFYISALIATEKPEPPPPPPSLTYKPSLSHTSKKRGREGGQDGATAAKLPRGAAGASAAAEARPAHDVLAASLARHDRAVQTE
jgi:hypothetical protein